MSIDETTLAEERLLLKKDFDALVERLKKPSNNESIESLKRLMKRPLPWSEQ